MKYQVTHITEYQYSDMVSLCQNEARLKPRNSLHQKCLKTSLDIQPRPDSLHERLDFFGNRVSYISIQQPHKQFTVTAKSEIETLSGSKDQDLSTDLAWEQVVKHYRTDLSEDILDARQYILNSPMVTRTRELASYAERSFLKDRPIVDAVHDLMTRIYRDFTYDPGFTTLATPLSQVLKHRRGVCQDFAHLAIGCLRAQGLAAKYVSGYIETLPAEGEEKLVGSDASHAWFSVYVPKVGWIDFDPTNNQITMDKHITVAWGRDYSDVTPLNGVIFGGGEHKLSVAVDVTRLS